jgi:hypothetical protein
LQRRGVESFLTGVDFISSLTGFYRIREEDSPTDDPTLKYLLARMLRDRLGGI